MIKGSKNSESAKKIEQNEEMVIDEEKERKDEWIFPIKKAYRIEIS